MSTFKDKRDGELGIAFLLDSIVFEVTDSDCDAVVALPKSDAPAIALAVLEAAGVEPFDDDEDWSTGEESQLKRVAYELVRYSNAKAESAAESAARDKRRDELAAEYFEGAYYHLKRIGYRRAIDRIIDTENELAKERAMGGAA